MTDTSRTGPAAVSPFVGDSEMAARMRAFDWSTSRLPYDWRGRLQRHRGHHRRRQRALTLTARRSRKSRARHYL
ncbi:MAG: hypothetical protein ACRDTS_10395, partial [Mycobacterium sp.]